MLFLSKKDWSTCQRLEDEFHFFFECSRYHDLRISLIQTYYRIRPSMFKLIDLSSSNSKKMQSNLSFYVFKAFKARE